MKIPKTSKVNFNILQTGKRKIRLFYCFTDSPLLLTVLFGQPNLRRELNEFLMNRF